MINFQMRPVILGAGLTGMAISHALSSAGIAHVLVGDRPTQTPRLGESLNAEGSLEIVRQFSNLAGFFFNKRRQALFFGKHTISFDSIQYAAAPAYYSLLGYPTTVQLLHVDRIGFDTALFDRVITDMNCMYMADRAVSLDYDPATDRINGIELASGGRIIPTYVFDATNHACFVARRVGGRFTLLGERRRVVFAHYRAADTSPAGPAGRSGPVVQHRWMDTTSLLRLDSRKDRVEGLSWCIPLGNYVSVGISVDPAQTVAGSEVLLDWVDKAWSTRGIDVRAAFPVRGAPVDVRHDHYNHERCHGRNWLLAGASCCEFWFPAAAGVGTGLVAARLAPEILKRPALAPQQYQDYLDQVARTHPRLEWLVRDDPWQISLEELRRRSWTIVNGNLKRLGGYLGLNDTPFELSFGDALLRLFESDRRLANPLHLDTAPLQAQATRLFATSEESDPWTDAPVRVPVLSRPPDLPGPPAILGLVDILSGRRPVESSAELVSPDLIVQIDEFQLRGVDQWNAWANSLRKSPRVTNLELVPGSLNAANTANVANADWTLTAQWQGSMGGRRFVSPQFSITFQMMNDRVHMIRTGREDYTFVIGDSILPPVAFAAVLDQLAAVQS